MSAGEAPDSPFFPVSHSQTPFIFPFQGGGRAGCGSAMYYKCPQPSSMLLPGEMRKKCTQLLPALAATKPRSGQLHWCLEGQREGKESYYFVHNTPELQW